MTRTVVMLMMWNNNLFREELSLKIIVHYGSLLQSRGIKWELLTFRGSINLRKQYF